MDVFHRCIRIAVLTGSGSSHTARRSTISRGLGRLDSPVAGGSRSRWRSGRPFDLGVPRVGAMQEIREPRRNVESPLGSTNPGLPPGLSVASPSRGTALLWVTDEWNLIQQFQPGCGAQVVVDLVETRPDAAAQLLADLVRVFPPQFDLLIGNPGRFSSIIFVACSLVRVS
jgi:hypothetical protein